MSRISQTLSLFSNLSSPSVGPNSVSEDKNVATVTEQFLPRRQVAVFGDQFVFQTVSSQQRINAKLVLLPPFPWDAPPFAKSVAYLSSLSGSVNAVVHRLPGAESHLFRLYIFAREASVKVALPPLFRGVVTVKNHGGLRQRKQIHRSRSVRDRMRRGFIRFDTVALENDDEVYIHAEGKIELCLMASLTSRSNGKVGWTRIDRHVRRILKIT
ncbi:hypothetical protein PAXRUDRAFT_826486 [Paxillus rubicundulus Ve08.2h10]|uniref:DUF7330 domain-containing protein n=1 Tax=Paxillus rubicundulus Ve08.2h10 TaxID=930991 RepID=A0A0D0E9Q9_9AGAM|nr:hypothetical protein PAXRUDRAFT_826486 [Paxillus rubicundulus Ve08.2h10]